MTNPSPEILRQLLTYEPETGFLFWKHRPAEFFKREQDWKSWNVKYANTRGFTALTIPGYHYGAIFGRMYFAHRVGFAIYNGHWPKQTIDHINGIITDNRIVNLRDVSRADNQRNQKLPNTNTSGVIGVSWNKTKNKWQAGIKVGGRNRYLGRFDDKEEAVAVRRQAEKDLGFHPNHGRVEL